VRREISDHCEAFSILIQPDSAVSSGPVTWGDDRTEIFDSHPRHAGPPQFLDAGGPIL
jgi:hypothetical protein